MQGQQVKRAMPQGFEHSIAFGLPIWQSRAAFWRETYLRVKYMKKPYFADKR